jgi:hypothetical protein
VTLDLQEDLVAGDADRDGQIAFLEWRSWNGKTLDEFHELDLNGDGFVTPREVEFIRGPAEEEEETQVAAADRRGPRGRDSAEESDDDADDASGMDDEQDEPPTENSRRNGRDDDDDSESDEDTDRDDERRSFRRDREGRADNEERDEDQGDERNRGSDESPDEARAAAERYFRLMDRDRDGEVASDEWQGGRIRGMFEDDGIDLDDSMSEDDFIDHYVRLSAGGG